MKQAERSSQTRSALVAAARELWARDGYEAAGTPAIAAAAGVTRGALYHQFKDKQALFAAVLESVEADVTDRLGKRVAASGATDPAGALRAAVTAWLDACEEPEVRQLLLVDGPRVLGWAAFRDITLRYGLGLTEQLLQAALGPDRAVSALAHVLIGALDEAAMYVAAAADRTAARAEVEAVLADLMDGLLR